MDNLLETAQFSQILCKIEENGYNYNRGIFTPLKRPIVGKFQVVKMMPNAHL